MQGRNQRTAGWAGSTLEFIWPNSGTPKSPNKKNEKNYCTHQKNPFKTSILGHTEQRNQTERLIFQSYSLSIAPTLKQLIFYAVKINNMMQVRVQGRFGRSKLLSWMKKFKFFQKIGVSSSKKWHKLLKVKIQEN